MVGEARAIGVHDIDIEVKVPAVPVGAEGDAAAVGRPGRFRVNGAILGEVYEVRAVGSHDVDLVEVLAKSDLVRRCGLSAAAGGRPG